ncbi:MAG: efflux RND transporter periplasmic adaptor subunit [Puniceicoccales bacterium]|nr:efflux RND transporter periplasmic adaptor subunit [Puniceicoccales bacterium]
MKRSIPFLLAVPLCALAAAGCRPATSSAGERVVPVQVAVATAKRVPIYVDAIGTCSAASEVDIQSQVGGQLVGEHFQAGSAVQRGQLLFSIDARPYEAQVMQARGQLREAEAGLAIDRLHLERSQPLVPCGHISQQDYDALQAAVERDVAKVESARGALQQAELQLEFCSIHSPIAGQAGYGQTNLGNVVSGAGAGGGGSPLVTIRQLDPLTVDFFVAETVFPTLYHHFRENGGLDCEVRSMADASLCVPARLEAVDNQVNARSGTVHLRATMANGDGRFWPGESVRVRVLLTHIEDAILAPEIAVGTGDGGSFVFVVSENGLAELRPVVIGQSHGRDVIFLQGLRAGDRVVTEGQFLLAPRTRVLIAPGADGAR